MQESKHIFLMYQLFSLLKLAENLQGVSSHFHSLSAQFYSKP